MFRRVLLVSSVAAPLAPGAALAHLGAHDAGGLAQGLAHALGSADHLMALVALGLAAAPVGLLAWQRRAARRDARRARR